MPKEKHANHFEERKQKEERELWRLNENDGDGDDKGYYGEHSLRAKVRACVLQQPHYFVSCDTQTSSDSGKRNPAGTPDKTPNADNGNKTNNFSILDAHCIDEVDDMDTAGEKK
jgi:hypothetical protein